MTNVFWCRRLITTDDLAVRILSIDRRYPVSLSRKWLHMIISLRKNLDGICKYSWTWMRHVSWQYVKLCHEKSSVNMIGEKRRTNIRESYHSTKKAVDLTMNSHSWIKDDTFNPTMTVLAEPSEPRNTRFYFSKAIARELLYGKMYWKNDL